MRSAPFSEVSGSRSSGASECGFSSITASYYSCNLLFNGGSVRSMALIFRQLFDPQSSTYTYLLACSRTREAILIDPVYEQVRRDAALIDELGLKLVLTLETHIHADHVTGASLLKRRTGSRVAVSAASGAQGADLYLNHGDMVRFGTRHLEVRATPG